MLRGRLRIVDPQRPARGQVLEGGGQRGDRARRAEIMARAWASSPDPLAGPMNSWPKLVFSTTLAEPLAWNNAHLAKNDLAEEVSALKDQPGDPLRTIGSISVVRQLMAAGLVDRLRLVVFPHVLGQSGLRVPPELSAGWPSTANGETPPGVFSGRGDDM